MHPYKQERRIFICAVLLGVAAIPLARFLAGADPTLPLNGMTRAIWIGSCCGILLGSAVVLGCKWLAPYFWRTVAALTIPALLVGGPGLGVLAWLLSGEFEWRTQGSADDTMVTLVVFGFVIGYFVAIGAQGLWSIDLSNRTIFSFNLQGKRLLNHRQGLHAVSGDTSVPTRAKVGL